MVNIKKSGVYRLYIKNKSYIGVSKNIENRIKTHVRNVKNYLNNKSNSTIEICFTDQLQMYNLPTKTANTFKIATFIIKNDLKLSDLKWEILEEIEYNATLDISDKEQYYINKYNSEYDGFNGLMAFRFRLSAAMMYSSSISKKSLNKMISDEEKKEKERYLITKKLLKNKLDIKIMPWIYYNLGDYYKEQSLIANPIWINYCELVLEKYNKK